MGAPKKPAELITRHRNGYKVRWFHCPAPFAEMSTGDDPRFYDTYNDALAAYTERLPFLEGKMTIEIFEVSRVDRVPEAG